MRYRYQWKLQVPWGKLTLVSRGHPDGEPVFLVHGRQDSSAIFGPLIDMMSDQYYYVALDMPGNGLSDAFPHVTNVPLPPNDLHYAVSFNSPPEPNRPFIEFNKFKQTLEYRPNKPWGPKLMRFHFLFAMELALLHLGWDKFIFIGHSMGCEQGLFYNVLYPNRITKMILIDAGPTLMRMQIEDPEEYHRIFYGSYYENYHKENFERKVYTKKSAIQAFQRVREMTDAQCAELIERSFQEFENADWQPAEEIDRILGQNSNEARNPNKTRNPNEARNPDEARNPNEARNPDGARNSFETRNLIEEWNSMEARNPMEAQNSNEERNSNEARTTNEAQNLTDTSCTTRLIQNYIREHNLRVAGGRNPKAAQSSNEAVELAQVIQNNNTDKDPVGYLSWDNRLKNLAPQNYGNEYYFQLFKTIPPTLLIAASDGARNIPNPKWRQGAQELLDKMAQLDNFHRVDVEGSHDVHYTHPERVAPYINQFLKDNKVSSKL